MDLQTIRELNNQFYQYITLYHNKIGYIFSKDNDILPKCNKNQRKSLLVIKNEGEVIQTELGRCMDLKKSTLTTLIDSLEEKGLVKRSDDKMDRRKKWVSLTEDGQRYTDDILEYYTKELSNILANNKGIDVSNAIDDLKKVVGFLQKIK